MNKKLLILLVAICQICCLTGCSVFERRNQSGVIAELYGQYLYDTDIAKITYGLSGDDSVAVADRFIRQWASDILLYEKAKNTANEQLEALVEDYRRSLYVHNYEQHYIAHRMPTTVADSLIEQFYNTHQDQFILDESIIKGIFLVLPQNTPDLNKLRRWLQDPNDDNLEHIEKYAYQYASAYELFTDTWHTATQLNIYLPLEKNDIQDRIRQKTQIEVVDSASVYLLQITDKYLRGEFMPLDYAQVQIEKILLSYRQTDYLKKQRDELYKDAIRFNQLKLYSDDKE